MVEQKRSVSPLAMVEMEVLEEGREWMRSRMEEKLQRLADDQGAISPPEPGMFERREDSAGSDTDDCREGRD